MFQTFISVFEWARDLYHDSTVVWCIVLLVVCMVVNMPLMRYLDDKNFFDNKVLEWYYDKVACYMNTEHAVEFSGKVLIMIITIIVCAIEAALLVFILIPLTWKFVQVIAGFISGYIFGFFAQKVIPEGSIQNILMNAKSTLLCGVDLFSMLNMSNNQWVQVTYIALQYRTLMKM